MQTIEARRRVGTGKGAGRRIRASGLVPAVLYGNKVDPVNVAVDPKKVREILLSAQGNNSLFRIEVSGGETVEMARVVEFQKDSVKRTITHCDFERLDPNQAKIFQVPIRIEGKSTAEKTGGRLVHVMRKTRVKCIPTDCPEAITIDVAPVIIGQSIRIADLPAPTGCTFIFKDN